MKTCLTNGEEVTTDRLEIDLATGQQKDHVVICPNELEEVDLVRPIRTCYIHTTCGTLTTMPVSIAKTYACNPKFYSSTFCCGCGVYLPVSEFTWEDGETVGS